MCGRRPVAGHSSIEGIERDREKYNALAVDGFVLLRFTPQEIEDGVFVSYVESCLARGGALANLPARMLK
jgi:hypothetical protein